MIETEKLNNQLSQIRKKIAKNTKALSGKNTPNKVKLLTREKAKLEKQEQNLLTEIQKAVKKSDKEHKKELKNLKLENAEKDREIDSLQRRVPMEAVDMDDFEIF